MTNEQRAHDIALSMLNRILDMEIQNSTVKAIEKGESTAEVVIEPYKKYKELYSKILLLVQRDFPNDNQ